MRVGVGLLMIGLGLIGVVLALWIVCKILPRLVKWTADIVSKIFRRS